MTKSEFYSVLDKAALGNANAMDMMAKICYKMAEVCNSGSEGKHALENARAYMELANEWLSAGKGLQDPARLKARTERMFGPWNEDGSEDPYETKYTELIEKVKKAAAKEEHNSVELRSLATEFRQFREGYKDAAAIADECERIARNQELKNKDITLTERMSTADNEQELKALVEGFLAMGDYPYASAKAKECEKRYNKLIDERTRMDKKKEEHHYYSEYAEITAEMQRLYQLKVLKPSELRKLADEWQQLSNRLDGIYNYRDAKTLADECRQRSEELSNKAETNEKLFKISKIAIIVIVGVVTIISVVYLVNFIRSIGTREPEPPPEEPAIEQEEEEPDDIEKNWNDAFGEYLQSENRANIAGESGVTATWSTGNIRFAELVDFDNDGIPEMVLILDLPELTAEIPEYNRFLLLILAYTDEIRVIYTENIIIRGSEIEDYAVAISSEGQSYLVQRRFDHDWSFTDYLTLSNGVWTSDLSVEFIQGYIAFDGPVEDYEDDYEDEDEVEVNDGFTINEDEFLVNGEHVSEAAYNSAETELLRIVGKKVLGANTVNNVQTLISSLGSTYMHGNIPAGSSLRQPMHRQLIEVIENTNDAVALYLKWQAGDRTVLFREADNSEWKMESRAGGISDVEPTFALEDDVLSIGFPTTDRLYYLSGDFTGRFSDTSGSNSETLTWTFIIG